MKKLIKEKNNILTDMLEGIALTNDNIEIISETVVVKKIKKFRSCLGIRRWQWS